MSISSALSNAATGLTASARAVQVVSSNVANALTEGYAARQLELMSSSLAGTGSGVRVAGVTRLVDPVLLGMTRDAGAKTQSGNSSATFWQRLEAEIGLPGEGLSKALSTFDSALISATERPDLNSRLSAVATSAETLAQTLGQIHGAIQTLRTQADAEVARDVKALNSGLARVDGLNSEIVRLQASGQSTLGLEDSRQALITSLSEIVPLREYARADGRMTLFTSGGQLMLDINPQEVGFSQSHVIDASMSVGAGLSRLTIGGRTVDMGSNGPMSGGRLSANFALRDTAGPSAQADIDALATTLVTRFQDTSADPSLLAGQPGLFTDAGAAVTGAPLSGIAGRLRVHAAILPSEGGDLWRLRAGINATAPGLVGDATQLRNLLGALNRPLSTTPGSAQISFAANLNDVTARISGQRQSAEDDATQSMAHLGELTQQMLVQGVDTDAEMQRLLAVEQAYSANARVITTADAMLRRLLEI